MEDIDQAAQTFWQLTEAKRVFGFYGTMGSGKTTFIHALCDVKKVKSHVGSPTFSIINEYLYKGGKIFHIDLYRLKDEDEIIRAGIEDCLYSGEICLIEWAEKGAALFPDDAVKVFINSLDKSRRRILISES